MEYFPSHYLTSELMKCFNGSYMYIIVLAEVQLLYMYFPPTPSPSPSDDSYMVLAEVQILIIIAPSPSPSPSPSPQLGADVSTDLSDLVKRFHQRWSEVKKRVTARYSSIDKAMVKYDPENMGVASKTNIHSLNLIFS